jgi:hypothetical protein
MIINSIESKLNTYTALRLYPNQKTSLKSNIKSKSFNHIPTSLRTTTPSRGRAKKSNRTKGQPQNISISSSNGYITPPPPFFLLQIASLLNRIRIRAMTYSPIVSIDKTVQYLCRCRVNASCLANDFLQAHTYGLSPPWIFSCLRKSCCRTNPARQISHRYGRSERCVWM